MSMNVFIVAEREITFTKKDGSRGNEIQRRKFDAWQTPTEITMRILSAACPAQAYIEWIQDRRVERVEPVFADDDIFGEGEPVGLKTVCEADEHMAKLNDWMEALEEAGFQIKFEMI